MKNHVMGRMLAQFREERGLTQFELAKRAKVTQGYIAQLEAGDKTPSLATLRKLSKALGIEAAELLK